MKSKIEKYHDGACSIALQRYYPTINEYNTIEIIFVNNMFKELR